jgi:GlpG protein
MRQIGTLPSETEARAFADYMLTQSIRTNVEQDGEVWAVWILEEDQVPQAKEELDAFRETPSAEKYALAKSKADTLREKEIKKSREVKKKVVRASETWSQSFMQRAPVTITLIVMSVAAVIVTTNPDKPFSFGSRIEPGRTWLSLAPIRESEREGFMSIPTNTFEAIFRGQVWRLFTPMFLHFGPLHLLFNMMWLRDLGSVIEARRGRWKYLLLVLLIAGISNAAQGIASGPSFGGMSGVVFGLFGYIWMQSRYVPSSGFHMPSNLVMLMLLYMGICYAGVIGGIANTAHTVGLIVGMIAGYAPKFWQDMSR